MASAKVLWAAKFHYPAGSGFTEHAHESWQLFYVTAGAGTIVIDGTENMLYEDCMAVVRKDQPHFLRRVEAEALTTLDMKFTVTDNALVQQLERLPAVMKLDGAPVRALLAAIRDEFRSRRLLYEQIADSLAEALLWELVRIHRHADAAGAVRVIAQSASAYSGLTRKIADYIEQNYRSYLDNDRVAESLGYNRNYCCAAFREGSGYTIGEYIARVRIQSALNAICFSDRTLAEIAQETGFKNVYHFSRVFKKLTGDTPSHIRKLEKDGLYRDHLIELLDAYRFDGGTQPPGGKR